ncbi:hypothetical protein TYRP_013112 [Tyrophagus putrescentiae]|nr:hypothetical protein TYRP_013112 [Tyrophagus putrescentiae]
MRQKKETLADQCPDKGPIGVKLLRLYGAIETIEAVGEAAAQRVQRRLRARVVGGGGRGGRGASKVHRRNWEGVGGGHCGEERPRRGRCSQKWGAGVGHRVGALFVHLDDYLLDDLGDDDTRGHGGRRDDPVEVSAVTVKKVADAQAGEDPLEGPRREDVLDVSGDGGKAVVREKEEEANIAAAGAVVVEGHRLGAQLGVVTLTLNDAVRRRAELKLTVLDVKRDVVAMPPRPPPPKEHRTDQNEIGKLSNVLWLDHVPHRAARGDVHVGVYRLTGGVLVAEVQLFGDFLPGVTVQRHGHLQVGGIPDADSIVHRRKGVDDLVGQCLRLVKLPCQVVTVEDADNLVARLAAEAGQQCSQRRLQRVGREGEVRGAAEELPEKVEDELPAEDGRFVVRTEGGGHLAALPSLVPPVARGTEGQRSHGQRRQKAWSSKAAVVNSSRLEKLIVLVVAAVAADTANAAQHELAFNVDNDLPNINFNSL